jgi:hypothetical protein
VTATDSRPGAGEDPGRDQTAWGVLLWSGLVCPAASEAIAREQADRLGGVECRIADGPLCRHCAEPLEPGRHRYCDTGCFTAGRLAYWRLRAAIREASR